MSVYTKFQSQKEKQYESKTERSVTYYSSSKSELETYVADNNLKEGQTENTEFGTIKSNNFYQEGPFWFCDVVGEISLDEDGIIYLENEESPNKHSLRTVNAPVSIRRLSTYRTCWDHYLWIQRINNETVNYSESYKNKTTDIPFYDSSGRQYAWSETVSDASLPKLPENSVWYLLCSPSKPDVTQVDYFTYQITEYGEYSTESKAAWVIQKTLNTIGTPLMGDMGLGGSWKCDDASLEWTGKKWRAQLTWTKSPDPTGWPTNMYPPVLKD